MSALTRSLHPALTLLTLGLLLLPSARARAHGLPPEVWEPLAEDDRGLTLVRLSKGLGQRGADGGFTFVCPAAWGGSASDSAAARSDGLIALATFDGVTVFDGGEFRPVPESAGARGLAAASSGGNAYVLLDRNGLYELARIERDRWVVLWRDAGPWHSIGASSSFVQLVALEEDTLKQALVATNGSSESRASARVIGDVITVQAGPVADAPYVVLRSASGIGHTLALLRGESLKTVLSAANSIAGPAVSSTGEAWMAIDGSAGRLLAEQFVPTALGEFVSGVSCLGASCYASVERGLRRLGQGGDVQLVVEIANIAAPDFERVPSERREECRAEWQDWKFDLVAAGMAPEEELDAGTPSNDAGLVSSDASAPLDASLATDAAHATPKERDQGCSLASGRGAQSASLLLLLLLARRLLRAR